MTTSSHQQMQGFTHLDPLTVISLSVTWVLAILTVICGVKFINKVCCLFYSTMLLIIDMKMNQLKLGFLFDFVGSVDTNQHSPWKNDLLGCSRGASRTLAHLGPILVLTFIHLYMD